MSRRGLARVHFGEYKKGESDALKALEYIPEDNITERERVKIIVMKARRGINLQNESLEKRKSSMQKAFAAKEGGIGDSRVKPDPKPKRVQQKPQSQHHFIIISSLVILLLSIIVYKFIW